MKQLVLIGILFLSGCSVIANIKDVRSSGCSWIKPLWLTESSITALRTAQATDPTVRVDRENIARHNRLWTENCPPE